MSKKMLLQEACKAAFGKIPPRAEQMEPEQSRDLFVEVPHDIGGQPPDLSSPYNQILYGRRGSGKTHQFKSVITGGKPWNERSDYIAFYFSANTFHRSIESTNTVDPPRVRARDCFRNFLEDFEVSLMALGTEILDQDKLWPSVDKKRGHRKDRFETTLLELSLILKEGHLIPRLANSVTKGNRTRLEQRDRNHEFGGGFNANIQFSSQPSPMVDSGIGASANASMQNRRSLADTRQINEEIVYQRSFGLPEIRRLLAKLGETINVKKIYLLIDEWSSLADVQIDFADMLKRSLFQVPHVVVKLAGYRHTTRLSNGASEENFRGIEAHADIAEAGDLDWDSNSPQCINFFYKILYKRLIYVYPHLAQHYGSIEQFTPEVFMGDIFTRNAGERLVTGSHGVLRDFLNAFNTAALSLDYDIYNRRISNDVVNKSLEALSRSVENESAEATDIGGFLLEKIKPIIAQTGKPYFFVPVGASSLNADVRRMVARRFLHPVKQELLHDSIAEEHHCFTVAHGFYLRWMKAAMYDNSDLRLDEDYLNSIPDITKGEVDQYMVQSQAKSVDTLLCVHCSLTFHSDADSFIKARLCPHCYHNNSELLDNEDDS